MNRIRTTMMLALLGLAASSAGVAFAVQPSTVTVDGKTIALTDSYAYLGSDPSGRGHCPVVVLGDAAFDKAALNATNDPWNELRRQQNGGLHTFVLMHLRNDGRAQIELIGDQPLYQGVSGASAVLSLTERNDRRVAGSYVSNNAAAESKPGHHIVWNLHFAAAIARSVDEAPHAITLDEEPEEEAPPPPPPPPPPPGKPGR